MTIFYQNKNLKLTKLTSFDYFIIIFILSLVMVLNHTHGRYVGKMSVECPPNDTIEHVYFKTIPQLDFTPENLAYYINALNISFPHIVYAQAVQETGVFTSNIFLENHNLFGMKQARVRPNLAMGTKRGHAYYTNWQESVIDYALWQAAHANHIRNEQEYLTFLDGLYAEDPYYVVRLETIIKRDNLLAMFLF